MRKVVLHVGAPKTGTTLVQDLLHLNRHLLRERGVLYPGERFDAHFLAALDLLGKKWGGLEKEAVGAWDAMVAEANAWEGDVIISHEVLAAASPRQVRRALSGLSGDVHVVYSVRDLARQIPAEWQEGVKHRRTMPYGEFVADLCSEQPRTAQVQWFWSVQKWPDVLERWASTLPADRVHVVTVPPPDAPRALLLQRFLDVLGIEPDWLPAPSERANPSLGAVETTLIRKLNERLPARRLKGPYYREFVRELLAHRTLANRRGSAKIAIPPDLQGWVASTTADWVALLEARGYDVVGELAELAPAPVVSPDDDPDDVAAEEELAVAYDAIEALVLELAHQAHEAGAGRGAATRRERLKQRAVALAGPRLAGTGLRVYRRLRRSRSSRRA